MVLIQKKNELKNIIDLADIFTFQCIVNIFVFIMDWK